MSAYPTLLTIHSWIRWIVVAAGVAAVLVAWTRWLRHERGRGAGVAALIYIIGIDIQLLLGIALFAVTPWTRLFANAPGEAMGNDVVRYWNIEHGFGMIVAIILAHIAKIASRRAPDEVAAHRWLAILLTISLLIVLATIPWPFMPYARPLFRL